MKIESLVNKYTSCCMALEELAKKRITPELRIGILAQIKLYETVIKDLEQVLCEDLERRIKEESEQELKQEWPEDAIITTGFKP
jgi:hypothetical protein